MKLAAATLALITSALAAAAPSASAQSLLDQQLGPKVTDATDKPATASPEKKDAPAAVATPAPKPVNGLGNPEIVSPEAAKKVDDQDLIRELTQPGSDKPDPQKIDERMKAMLGRMHDSANLLKQKDPGDVTQETQSRIVTDLDVMIQLARQQQQNGPPQPGQPQQQQPGQARQPGQPQPGQGSGEGGTTAATTDDSKGGQSAAVTGDMRNTGAANWGGLPPRDRDEISHGANEEYLAAYKGMIDRYYQALAEMGKSRNR